MKNLKITVTYTAKVPDNFKLTHLHEKEDGKILSNFPVLKVGKKFAMPDMVFFAYKENADGTLEGILDNDLTDKLWSYIPTIDHTIEIL